MKTPRVWPLLIFPAFVVISACYAVIRVGLVAVIVQGPIVAVSIIAAWLAWRGSQPPKRKGD